MNRIEIKPVFEKYKGKESNFQKSFARYLDALGVLWYHPPNGGSRHKLEAVNLKRDGVKAGVPDVCICEARKGFHGFYIELKVAYNTPTAHQLKFMERLESNGYKIAITKSLDEAIHLIDEYLK